MITVKYRQNVKEGTLFSSEFYSLSLDLGSGTATQVTTLTSAIPHSAWKGTQYRLLKGPGKHTEKSSRTEQERGIRRSAELVANTDHRLNGCEPSSDWTMTEETGVGLDHPATPTLEQQAPHFLQDVIFHGKFKVSDFKIQTVHLKAVSDNIVEICKNK